VVELPDVVRNRAIAEGHADWVDQLSDTVAGIEHDWSIVVDRTYDEGTEAFVADAVLADGRPAVLKVLVPRRSGGIDDHEATVLRLADGDVHQWNALQAGEGFKLVDPDGLVGDPEYDLGVILREDPDEPLAADPLATARWMADRHGLDATAIWEWSVIERVSTGLSTTEIGLQPVGRQLLALADRLAAP